MPVTIDAQPPPGLDEEGVRRWLAEWEAGLDAALATTKHYPGGQDHDQSRHAGGGGRGPVRTFTSDEGYEWHYSPEVLGWSDGLSGADRDALTNYAGFGSGAINAILRGQEATDERFWRTVERPATDAELDMYRKHLLGESSREPLILPGGGRMNIATQGWMVSERFPDTERIESARAQARELEAVIRERGYTTTEDMEVMRGAFVPGLTREVLESSVGRVVTEPGFSSTMVGDAEGRAYGYGQAAQSEYEYRQGQEKRPVEKGVAMLQRIRVPAGSKTAPIEAARTHFVRQRWPDQENRRTESELLLPPGGRFRVRSVRELPPERQTHPNRPPTMEVELDYLP